MSELFSLRPAREEDLDYINTYTFSEGMDKVPSLDNITVAANDEDQVVGFIRIVIGANGAAHVNPVITVSTWRGYGVGRALMEDALVKYGELRLVSRGSSVGFYKTLGYDEISWNDIDKLVVDDCDHCEAFDECKPLPMGKVL